MSLSGHSNNMVEVRIPILQRGQSVIDEHYGGSGPQFEAEMKKMEEEMNNLTGQINEGNKRIASRIVQKTTTTTTRTSSGGSQHDSPQLQHQQQPAIQYQQQPQQQQHGGNVQSQSSHTSTYSHQTSGTQGQHQSSPQPMQQQQIQHNQHQQQQQNMNQHTSHSSSPSPAPGSQTGGLHSSTHKTTTHSTVSHQTSGSHLDHSNSQQNQLDQSNNQELQQWMSQLNSPLVRDRSDISGQDGKCLRLRFDVSQYTPDEVSVKTVDGKLRIHAKHEEKSEHKSAYREFNKEFSLPTGTDPAAIKSTLSKDGILTVEAPLPGQASLMGGHGGQHSITNF